MIENAAYMERKESDTDKLFDLLDNYLPWYVRNYFTGSRSLGIKTRLEYAKDFKTFLLFLTSAHNICAGQSTKEVSLDALNTLNKELIDEYLTWLEEYTVDGVTRQNDIKGINRKIASLKCIFKYLQANGKIQNNPTILIECNKLPREESITTFSMAQKNELLNYIKADAHSSADGAVWSSRKEKLHQKTKLRDYAIFMTLFGTGLRISELTGIDIDDIDFYHNTIYVHRKGNINTEVYYNEEVSEALIQYVEEERPSLLKYAQTDDISASYKEEKAFFLSQKGTRLTDRALEMRLDTYCDDLFGGNHPFHPHVCRATYGTELYNEYSDIKLVADALGHSSIETTSRHYAQATKEHKKMAASLQIVKDNID